MTCRLPRRIVCLTEETCETLYLLGEQDRIVGISGFTVRPARARREKPKVAAFTSARIDKILALEPDLVLGFSDLQADIAAALIRAGLAVHVFNQRTLAGILAMIETVGALVGAPDRAAALVAELEAGMGAVAQAAARLPRRPCVYFEEWDAPLISGIGWVSELITLAGGEDCFPELAGRAAARERVIADPAEVVRRAPELIIGSWCGKRFRPDSLAARPGWDAIPAVRRGQVFEIKSCDILQPGPAALTDGLKQLHARIAACAALGP
ncbi:cobalamin-binding protein [Immundisolibacter sp.]|uniref:cobalamin-binding protein n=1 Tax=Immundisolibacter sp. TaxID=1934948 RepID=UPI00261F10C3|nr:cobalamin-binding protein [Immundisolibacter sp.]MDD3651932.1 cobalamin-binding protein [Immundisolibacter sp.]